MSKFVRDKAHCKHEAYTKEEANAKMNELVNGIDVYKKSDFAIVDTTTTIGDSASVSGIYTGGFILTMPDGFTSSNSVVISKQYGVNNPNTTDTKDDIIRVSLLSYENDGTTMHRINGSLSTTDSEKAGVTYQVRLVLMKIA